MITVMLVIFGWLSVEANSVALDALAHRFFTPHGMKVGLEVELTGLPITQIKQTLHRPEFLGGDLEIKLREYPLVQPIPGQPRLVVIPSYKLQNSRIGKVVIKPESNEVQPGRTLESALAATITEIVTNPITDPKAVGILQNSLDQLVKDGAQGTSQGHAVSIQVNVEIAPENRLRQTDPNVVLNILKNYHSDENRKVLEQVFQAPDFRRQYLGDLTPGLKRRIYSPGFRVSSWQELYDLLMYRQVAERLLGEEPAWNASMDQVREWVRLAVHEQGVAVLLPVVKWNYVRFSSLMMQAVPWDWMSKYLRDTFWVKAAPILEFREPNNDFNVLQTVHRIVGFVNASRELGEVKLSEISIEKNFNTPVSCRQVFL
jgi:hypothetical protein